MSLRVCAPLSLWVLLSGYWRPGYASTHPPWILAPCHRGHWASCSFLGSCFKLRSSGYNVVYTLICGKESAISVLPTKADVANDGNSAMQRLLLIL